jgi:hypothetical protein
VYQRLIPNCGTEHLAWASCAQYRLASVAGIWDILGVTGIKILVFLAFVTEAHGFPVGQPLFIEEVWST